MSERERVRERVRERPASLRLPFLHRAPRSTASVQNSGDREEGGQTDRQTDTQRDRQTDKQRQTDRQTGRETNTDRQTGKSTRGRTYVRLVRIDW